MQIVNKKRTMKDMKMRLSTKEKKDLDKFTKFLALKATEVIIQSRLGEKVSTSCKPKSTGTDWFNLNINDLPEVVVQAKKILNSEVLLSKRSPYCVEISLRTAEGDQMVLETWCARLLPEQCDSVTRNGQTQTIYNRMGILLKSLVSVTRVTPAYKLSRRQGPDSYVLCYRIYMDEPQHHCLGDGLKQIRIGQICTPIGTLQLTVAYRTKMTISPTQANRDDSLMLKSDHFSPINGRYQGDDRTSSLSETMKIGAFVDKKKKVFEAPQLIMPDPPFYTFFADKISLNDINLEEEDLGNNDINSPKTEKNETNGNAVTAEEDQKTDTLTMVSTNDDFIMVDLKTPFANPTGEKFELSKFFREWQTAPLLETFKDLPTVEGQDLQKQLDTFESDLNEFDSIVQSLCQSSPNNN